MLLAAGLRSAVRVLASMPCEASFATSFTSTELHRTRSFSLRSAARPPCAPSRMLGSSLQRFDVRSSRLLLSTTTTGSGQALSEKDAYDAAKALFAAASKPLAGFLQKGMKGDAGEFEFTDAEKSELSTLLRRLEEAQALFNLAGKYKTAEDQQYLDLSMLLLRKASGDTVAADQMIERVRGMFQRGNQQQQQQNDSSASSSMSGEDKDRVPREVQKRFNEALQLSQRGDMSGAFSTVKDAIRQFEQHFFTIDNDNDDTNNDNKDGQAVQIPAHIASEALRLYELAGSTGAKLAEASGFSHSDVDRAADYFERGVVLSQTDEAREKFLVYLGGLFDSASLWDRAVEAYRRLEGHSGQCGSKEGEWHALDRIGTAYAQLGRRRDAIGTYERLLAVSEQLADREERARAAVSTLTSMAQLHDQDENPAEAFALLHRALGLARTSNNYQGQHAALTQLGRTQLTRGMPKEALLNLKMAAAVAPSVLAKAQTLAFLGEAHDELGDLERATEALDAALVTAREMNVLDLQRLVLTNLGKVYNRKVQPAKALEFLQESAQINEQLRDRVGLMKVFSLMVTSYRGLGKEAEAKAHIKKVYDLDMALKSANKP